MPRIQALGRLRQEHQESKVRLCYIVKCYFRKGGREEREGEEEKKKKKKWG